MSYKGLWRSKLRQQTLIWQNIPLPPWNPQRLFELFLRHLPEAQPPATVAEREEYAQQLMVHIAANLGRTKWFVTLRRHRLDPDDVTANLLMYLIQKTPGMVLATPCLRVLLKVLNVAIFRRLVTALRQRETRGDLPRRHSPGYSPDQDQPLRPPEHHESPFIVALESTLRNGEESICRGNWTDQISICVLYRYLCRQVIRQNTILAHDQLPPKLGKRVSLESHSLISYRLNKFICESAAAMHGL